MKRKLFTIFAIFFACFGLFSLTACSSSGGGINQPAPGVDQPAPGVDQPEPGVDQPEPGVDQPAPNMTSMEKVATALNNIERSYEQLMGSGNENGSGTANESGNMSSANATSQSTPMVLLSNDATLLASAMANESRMTEDEALSKIYDLIDKDSGDVCENGFQFTEDTTPPGIDQFRIIKGFYDIAQTSEQEFVFGEKYAREITGIAYIAYNGRTYKGGEKCEKTDENKYNYIWDFATSIDIDDKDFITCLVNFDITLTHVQRNTTTKHNMYVEIGIDYDFSKTETTNYKITMKTLSSGNTPTDVLYQEFENEKMYEYSYMNVEDNKIEEFRQCGYSANKDMTFDTTYSCFQDYANESDFECGIICDHWWKKESDNKKYKYRVVRIGDKETWQGQIEPFAKAICDGLGVNITDLDPAKFTGSEGKDRYIEQLFAKMKEIYQDDPIYMIITENDEWWEEDGGNHNSGSLSGSLEMNNEILIERNKVDDSHYYDSHLYDLYKKGLYLKNIEEDGYVNYVHLLDADWFLKKNDSTELPIDLYWSCAKLLKESGDSGNQITLIAKYQELMATATFQCEEALKTTTPSKLDRITAFCGKEGELVTAYYDDGFVQNISEINDFQLIVGDRATGDDRVARLGDILDYGRDDDGRDYVTFAGKKCYIERKYTVTFDSKGGTEVEPMEIAHNESCGKLPKPTKEVYTFGGWWYTYYDNGEEKSTRVKDNMKYPFERDITLWAMWFEEGKDPFGITFNVTFNSCGGTNKEPMTAVTYENNCGRLPEPTKDGYIFVGWYGDSDYGVIVLDNFDEWILVYQDTHGSSADPIDFTLYAKWRRDPSNMKFIITFDSKGGTAIEQMTVTYKGNNYYSSLPEPKRSNDSFWGWYFDDTCQHPAPLYFNEWFEEYRDEWFEEYQGEGQCSLDDPINVTLHARWDRDDSDTKFKITFDSKGGPEVAEQEVTSENAWCGLTEPEREGYMFGGWYFDDTYQNKCEDLNFHTLRDAYGTIIPDNGDNPCRITLYAKWTTESGEPTGDTTGENQSEPTGDTTGENQSEPTGENEGEPIANMTFIVTFNSYGGTPIEEKEMTSENHDDLLVPEKEGYTFGGWYFDDTYNSECSNDYFKVLFEEYGNDTIPNDMDNPCSITLYAKWTTVDDNEPIANMTFIVTFNSCDGTPIEEKEITSENYGDLPLPTRADYTFGGWYFDETYEDEFPTDYFKTFFEGGYGITTIPEGTDNPFCITLYAKWTEESGEPTP